MSKIKSISQQWDQYNSLVLPATAPAIQRTETRRAFYCGAQAVLSVLATIAGDDLSEDAGALAIEGLDRECGEFAKRVARGEA